MSYNDDCMITHACSFNYYNINYYNQLIFIGDKFEKENKCTKESWCEFVA